MYNIQENTSVITLVKNGDSSEIESWLIQHGWRYRYFVKEADKFPDQVPGVYLGNTLITHRFDPEKLENSIGYNTGPYYDIIDMR